MAWRIEFEDAALKDLTKLDKPVARRIEFAELQRYQQAQQATSEQALQRLSTLSEDLGLEF